MDSVQLTLVLIAAFWAAFNAIVSAYKIINEKRDQILGIGAEKGEESLSLDQQRLIFHNDWVPLKFGISFACLTFFVIIVFIPELTDKSEILLRIVCYIASVVPLFSFCGFFFFGLSEYAFIKRSIDERSAKQSDEKVRAISQGTIQQDD